MTKILFICHGNICRSPMAEFIMKDLAAKAGRPLTVASAATSWEEIGCDMYPPARRCLAAHGVPFAPRAARQVTAADYDKFDLLVIMDSLNRRNLSRIIPSDPAGKIRTLLSFTGQDGIIDDPWYTDDFETAYRDIRRGCEALLNWLT